jgi:hypothetical protein
MTDILTAVLVTVALVAALATLVRFARHDSFAAPGTGYQPRDEFGPLADRRRPA